MELDQVPEIGSKQVKALKRAGVKTAEDLSLLQDVDAAAKKAALPVDKLTTLRAAARLHIERALAEAGVGGETDLVKADLAALSDKTGITVDHLTRYQDAARKVAGDAPAEEAPVEAAPQEEVPAAAEATPEEPEEAPAEPPAAADAAEEEERSVNVPVQGDDRKDDVPDKVVLREESALAVVVVNGRRVEGVRIVTARENDDGAAVLKAAEGDVVLLQEKAVVAPARLDGAVKADLPIYSAKQQDDGTETEIRVRIHALREDDATPSPGEEKPKAGKLMGRFLKRKN